MSDLTYRTAGESHGKGLITLVEGLPAGVPVDSTLIDGELRRRQGGYGRGGRQKIETDRAEFITGGRMGHTIGSPGREAGAEQGFAAGRPGPPPPAAPPAAGSCRPGRQREVAHDRLPRDARAGQ